MRVDTSPDERIPMLLEFSRTLSSLKDPRGALGFIVDSMRRAFGPRGYVAMTTEAMSAAPRRSSPASRTRLPARRSKAR